MRLFGSLVAVTLILVACTAPTDAHWADDGVHVVDGYWILAEHPCDVAAADGCIVATHAAETALDVDPRAVVRAATAELPRRWVRADGREIVLAGGYSGPPPEFVLLDLADGTRRVTVFKCGGVPYPDGSMICGAFGLDAYRVGHAPIDPP